MATQTIKLPTIKELRADGWKVRATHYRYFHKWNAKTLRYDAPSLLSPVRDMKQDDGTYRLMPVPNGGKIILELRDPQGNEYRGESVCSKTDSFNKRAGRALAMCRALKIPSTPNKFKAGQKVWLIGQNMKAVEATLDYIALSTPRIDPDDGTVTFTETFCFNKGVFPIDVSVENVFATKEELLEFVAAS